MTTPRLLHLLALPVAGLLLVTPACGGDDDATDAPDAGDGDGDGDADAAPPCEPTAGMICTLAGNGEAAYYGDDGPALDAAMSLPTDVLVADDGTVYILDWNNHRIRKLTPDGQMVHVAGRGELGGTLDDPANSDFNHPTNIIFDATGDRILIAAWHNSMIRALDLGTGDITTLAGDGRRAYFGDEGPAATAVLDLPAALALAPDGDLVVMDQANQVIRSIDQDGVIHRVAGRCVLDAPPPAGPGPCDAPVACPGGSGKLTCGDPVTTCGGACNPSYAEGDALAIRMAQPFGQSAEPGGRILFDPDGALLFADTSNHLIRKISPEGEVSIVAGTPPVDGAPQVGYAGDGGPATEALLDFPVDLALADDGTLYFTDVYNHCVRAVAPDGVISTAVGQCGERGFAGDRGPAADALLKLPFGLSWADGVLYVADTGNQRIRAVPLP